MTDYTIIFDGGSRGNHTNGTRYGYGSYAVIARDGRQRIERLEFGDVTNNVAEYKALIAGVEDLIGVIEEAGRDPSEFSLEVRGDSALVINQVNCVWRAKSSSMGRLRAKAQRLLDRFRWTATWHPREESVRVLGH